MEENEKMFNKTELLEYMTKAIEHFILIKQGYCGDISSLDQIKIRQTLEQLIIK